MLGQQLVSLLFPQPGGHIALARLLGVTQRYAFMLLSGQSPVSRKQLSRLEERARRVAAGERREVWLARAEREATAEIQRASEALRVIDRLKSEPVRRAGRTRKRRIGRPRKPSPPAFARDPEYLRPGEEPS